MSNNTNVPVINVPLLRKVLEHIEAHGDEWNQVIWRAVFGRANRCDTAMCFAGHAAHMMDCEWADVAGHDGYGEWVIADEADREFAERADNDASLTETEDGTTLIHCAWRAQRLLGLTNNQRMELFSGGNNLEDLQRIVGELERKAAYS